MWLYIYDLNCIIMFYKICLNNLIKKEKDQREEFLIAIFLQ